MSYKLYSDEEKRLQRKLIPLNLLIAIIALIAAISLVIMPLLKINVSKAAASFMNESEEGNETFSQYSAVLDEVDAELAFAPLDMAKVLFAPKNEKGLILVDKFMIENGLLEGVLVSGVNISLAVATQAVDEENIADLDIGALNEALYKIDTAKSEDDVIKVLDDYLTVLETQLNFTLTAEERQAAQDNCLELYDNTVEATGGSFSVEKMLCVNMSPEGVVYTSYSDLAIAMFNGEFSTGEGEADGLTSITDMMNAISEPYGYLFIFVAFHALMWVILFLFAFFRIFAKNKRFTMWYVKLVSCWPCIIFFLLPFAVSKVAASAGLPVQIAGIIGAITSMTWISGICYLVLWALSICWAFPIKHKIRKLRKGR